MTLHQEPERKKEKKEKKEKKKKDKTDKEKHKDTEEIDLNGRLPED